MIGVIGLGNFLRGDDGIGLTVIENLEKKLGGVENLRFINFGAAGLGLINIFEEYPSVILIDAINAGLEAGVLKIFEMGEGGYNKGEDDFSTHELNLAGIFRLYKGMGLESKVYIAGIQIKETAYGKGLSRELGDKVEEITEDISSFIRRILSC